MSVSRERARVMVAALGLAAAAGLAMQWSAGQGAAQAAAPRSVAPALAGAAPPEAPAPRPEMFPAAQPAPAPMLHIALAALQRGPDGRPIALLGVNGSPAHRFATGDVVSLGVRLQRIERHAVVLQRGRNVERVALPPGTAALPEASPAVAARPVEPGVIAAPAGRPAGPPSAVDRAVARARAGLT